MRIRYDIDNTIATHAIRVVLATRNTILGLETFLHTQAGVMGANLLQREYYLGANFSARVA
jgi:hypothetical protein